MPVNNTKIRELRLQRGWTLAEAARPAGMKRDQQWHVVEKGERKHITAETLWRFARALGLPMDELMTDEVRVPTPRGRFKRRGRRPGLSKSKGRRAPKPRSVV